MGIMVFCKVMQVAEEGVYTPLIMYILQVIASVSEIKKDRIKI